MKHKSEKELFDKFLTSLNEASGDTVFNDDEKSKMFAIWTGVQDFLSKASIENLSDDIDHSTDIYGIESLQMPLANVKSSAVQNIDPKTIIALCEQCKVPEEKIMAASRAVAFELINANKSLAEHISPSRATSADLSDGVRVMGMESFLPPENISQLKALVPAMENFGKTTDAISSDLRTTIMVTMMRFSSNITDQMLHRVQSNNTRITIPVTHSIAYDLTKSMDDDPAVRNGGDHRIPMISLASNPSQISTELKTINLLEANDTSDDFLVADGRLRFGKKANMFKLAAVSGKLGYDAFDYSDLVADGAKLGTIFVQVTYTDEPDVVSIIPINLDTYGGARFTPFAQSKEASERITNLNFTLAMDSTTLNDAGVVAPALAQTTGDAFIELDVNVTGNLNIRTSDILSNCNVTAVLKTRSGEAAESAAETEFAKLTIVPHSYTPNAKYSEENVRKTSTAITTETREMSYTVGPAPNILVQYSIEERRPEELLRIIADATTIGDDWRHIYTNVIGTINTVEDRLANEVSTKDFKQTVRYDFASGMQVTPAVITDTLAISDLVKTQESGRVLGNVRAVVEKYFIELIARLVNDSKIDACLDNGEPLNFRVLTSGLIQSTIFNVPHFHSHLDKTDKVTLNNDISFSRILPSQVKLEMCTTIWDYMADKILLIPYRPTKSKELVGNFGQVWDNGTFVANTDINSRMANYRHIITNNRSQVIPTTPVAALITVTKIADIFAGIEGLNVT